MSDVVVIGLDGAGFTLLDRWLDDGTLSTLGSFIDEGRWSALRSTIPPVTSPAWRCYSGGVNPGKQGVFWWENVDREEQAITVPDSRSYAAPDVWDYLGEEGYTSGVVNMPTTYPPRELNGWMVGGVGYADEYTYPAALQAELEDEVGYRGKLDAPINEVWDDPEYLSEILSFIDERFDAAKHIRSEYDPDFLHMSIFSTNAVQHYHWAGEVNERLWSHVDDRIDDLVDDDDNVIVMSDHGSNRIDIEFHINAWLEANGYLTTTRSASDYLHGLGITEERLSELTRRLGIWQLVHRVVPAAVKGAVPTDDGTVAGSGKAEKIDWERTTAIASGQGPIYVLADGAERERVMSELKRTLSTVRAPDGTPIVRDVYDAEEVYEGPFVEAGPDLVVDQADHVHMPGDVGGDEPFVDTDRRRWQSKNHRDGVLIARGPDVDDGGELDGSARIYDLAPTILHWYGIDVPDRMDGRVLSELFAPGSDPAERDVTVRRSNDDEKSVAERGGDEETIRTHLEDLGYLQR